MRLQLSHRYSLLAGAMLLVMLTMAAVPNSAEALYLDPATGLQWLEFQFGGGTFNDVTQQLQAGGALEGYRYASVNEVLGLFDSHGITYDGQRHQSNYAPVNLLMQNLAQGIDDGGFSGHADVFAGTGTPGAPGTHVGAFLSTDRPHTCSGGGICQARAGLGGDIGNGDLARLPNWIVLDTGTNGGGGAPVPEPATLLLFGSGLAGLAAKRRMRST